MSKYLTYEERLEIQQGLKNQLSFGKIAISIGKDRTTVAKEIKKLHTATFRGHQGRVLRPDRAILSGQS